MDTALFHGDLVNSNRILYTPSTFAKVSLIYLQEIGQLEAQKPHISKRSNMTSYLFFIVLSGSGILEYDGNTYRLSTGDCVFIDCNKAYYHQTSNNLWKLKWIHFYGSNMNNIYNKYIERGGKPRFQTKHLAQFEEIWKEIYDIALSSDYIRDMKIFEKLTSLLTLLMNESWNPDKGRTIGTKKQNLSEIQEYLDTNFHRQITLDELENTFYINKYYLTRIFKEQFGLTINNYLIQKRITRAKQLLRFSNKSIETIGIESGMGDPHYFSRIFKKVEGISPSEYRKMW